MPERFCEVIVDVAHQNVDRLFTYRLPEGMDIGKGHRVLVPFAGRTVEGYVLGLTQRCDLPPAKVKDVLRPLDEEPALLPHMVDLALWLRQNTYSLLVDALRLLIPAPMRAGRAREKTRRTAEAAVEGEALAEALNALRRAPKQMELLALLAKGSLPTAELPPGSEAVLRALCAKGYAVTGQEQVRREPHRGIAPDRQQPFAPTPEQDKALGQLRSALGRRAGAYLLHGVTGSGKTEVYLQIIEEALGRGMQAILLVPEIALTPQMVNWFRARFPGDAAVLHSRLSPGERLDEWLRIRRGEARLAVGARSAVFAPFENLGVVVVDEEHEGTYKSDHAPRYDAREVALERGRREGALVVLGSATPDVCTYRRALAGELTLLQMKERANRRPMPDVQVVDMRQELVKGNRTVFSQTLLGEMKAATQAGRQVMLLLNRRGYAPFVTCRACGKTVKCRQCDVSMTYHQTDGLLHCHYCEETMPVPKTCPQPACGSPYIKYFGAGTQKVEEELRELLPGVCVERMDVDTTRGKDGHEKILTRFREGATQVLIGTQMIAKGHDFPRVTLVGVLAADLSLHVPDYRSEERTFQLITQMAGRAGRGLDPGRVIVQTYDPGHYAVQMGVAGDYRAFYEREMRRREAALYPPVCVILRFVCVSDLDDAARDAADDLWGDMSAFFDAAAHLRRHLVQMNARPAPIPLLRGEARHMLFLKLYDSPAIAPVYAEMARLCQLPRPRVKVHFEVNPVSLF